AGGGGRIAVYYKDASGFSGFSLSSAEGGCAISPGYDGVPGTLNFIDTSSPYPSLVITEYSDLGSGSNHYNYVTVLDGGQLDIGEGSHIEVDADVRLEGASRFLIGGGSTVTIHGDLNVMDESTLNAGCINRSGQIDGQWQGKGVTLTAWRITVASNATITASGNGYIGGSDGIGFGLGGGNATSSYASGGGHGGIGGAGQNGSPAGGPIFGSIRRPTEPGSGGGSAGSSGAGGAGGGALRIIAWEQFHLDGALRADGGNGNSNDDAGGGSGGSIWVDANLLSGSGLMSAEGGNGYYYGGGGGGGCIAVYYWDSSSWTPNLSVTGGSEYRDGSAGTFVTGEKQAYWWLGSEIMEITPSHDIVNLDINFLIPGTTYILEQSSTMTNWATAQTFTAQGSETNLNLTLDHMQGYYRVQTQIEVPPLDSGDFY
ncbi:MAG: hypothetical protein JXR40_07745, partial [Pontiellaceae bacterium]|nr:hypothetical protein [Pontiellaceae bacterium]